jgi:hypothetical protein
LEDDGRGLFQIIQTFEAMNTSISKANNLAEIQNW